MNKIWHYLSPPSYHNPQFLIASKAAFLIICYLSGYYFSIPIIYVATLALGVVAAALADHPALYVNPLKSLWIMLISFSLAAYSVTWLYHYPVFFAVGIFSSTFLFVMLAALEARFGPIAMSALIAAIYTMLGYAQYQDPWQQPWFLLGGALSYILLSFIIHAIRPNQSLRQHSKELFILLAKYQAEKARYFKAHTNTEQLQLSLAQLSSQASLALAQMRRLLLIRQAQKRTANQKSGYLNLFFKAQLLSERIISSHIDYAALHQKLIDTDIPKQLHFIMLELAKRISRQTEVLSAKNTLADTIARLATRLRGEIHLREALGPVQYNQLSYMLANLKQMEKITRQDTPFPTQDFQFEAIEALTWKVLWQRLTNPTNRLFRHALRQALCMLAGYGIILLIPGPSHGQDYWLLLTTLLVTKPNYSATRQKLFERIAGTLIGIAIASGLVAIHMPTMLILIITALSGFLFFWYFSYRYDIAVIMITIFVALSLNLLGVDSLVTVSVRVVATLLGALLVYLAVRFIWPDWLGNHTPAIMTQLLKQIRLYQNCIFNHYQKQQALEDEPYRMARFHAHTAEAELMNHWRGLLSEPVSRRTQLSLIYQLSGHFHAYLSHLSALALYRNRTISPRSISLLGEINQTLMETLSQIESVISQPQPIDMEPMQQIIRTINEQLRQLIIDLHGDELLIAYQLQQMTENLEQIQSLLMTHLHVPELHPTEYHHA
ncbi:FUSC family membrane protein [Celerinatantimonas sp. YJH-8]|uniref:FUSC family membrane protein n=1 Tax=Celerinatantimonas sp. YJH-8 TaxID=3228714 RepID=UPI0038C369C9